MVVVKTLLLAALLLAPPAPARRAAARPTDAQIGGAGPVGHGLGRPGRPGRRAQAAGSAPLQVQPRPRAGARALGVQGLLEDRLGRTSQAAATFHKLEQGWPRSPYLAEGQVIMAEAAAEHKRYQEAESRLHKALDADLPAESQRRSQELLLWSWPNRGGRWKAGPSSRPCAPAATPGPARRAWWA